MGDGKVLEIRMSASEAVILRCRAVRGFSEKTNIEGTYL
jgi:hypothetical protein